ncbi:uncharacterized protein LOC127463876 [Manacus candei]|uniref:uncharacterized protein LOC127463876 n=1 Tax=Manacus candei TaxID=415023 RepID=UPI0022268C7B|nr:uncharacterized protein LOC127463876 [Manacus candei]
MVDSPKSPQTPITLCPSFSPGHPKPPSIWGRFPPSLPSLPALWQWEAIPCVLSLHPLSPVPLQLSWSPFRLWKGLSGLPGSFSSPGEHPQLSQPGSRAEGGRRSREGKESKGEKGKKSELVHSDLPLSSSSPIPASSQPVSPAPSPALPSPLFPSCASDRPPGQSLLGFPVPPSPSSSLLSLLSPWEPGRGTATSVPTPKAVPGAAPAGPSFSRARLRCPQAAWTAPVLPRGLEGSCWATGSCTGGTAKAFAQQPGQGQEQLPVGLRAGGKCSRPRPLSRDGCPGHTQGPPEQGVKALPQPALPVPRWDLLLATERTPLPVPGITLFISTAWDRLIRFVGVGGSVWLQNCV